jgi:hypothetical protein
MSDEFEDWIDDDYQYTEHLKNNPIYGDYEDFED